MTWWQKLFGFGSNDRIEGEPDPQVVEEMKFLDLLREKGCVYNDGHNSWERNWVVATWNGSERSSEVYTKNGGKWKVTMYGNDGDVFFEHEIDSKSMVKEREERGKRIKKEEFLLAGLRRKYGDNYENHTY
tara:strand:+ start:202 stop:594 length:393 start_codon:yes stop_codon:yes gene_type:complete